MPDFIWFQNVVLPVLGMGMGAFVLWNVFRIANRALDRKHEREMALHGGASVRELAQLRDRVEALEDLAPRIQEIEERLDFAERVLTSGRGRDGAAP